MIEESKFDNLARESGVAKDSLKRLYDNRFRRAKNEELAWNQLENDVKKSTFGRAGSNFNGVVFAVSTAFDVEGYNATRREFTRQSLLKDGKSEQEVLEKLVELKLMNSEGKMLNRFLRPVDSVPTSNRFKQSIWGVTQFESGPDNFVMQFSNLGLVADCGVSVSFNGRLDAKDNSTKGHRLLAPTSSTRFIANGDEELNKLLVADKETLKCQFIEDNFANSMITLDKLNEWIQKFTGKYDYIFVARAEVTRVSPDVTRNGQRMMYFKDIDNEHEPLLCYVSPYCEVYSPGSIVYIFGDAKIKGDGINTNIHGIFPIDANKVEAQNLDSSSIDGSRFV